MQVLGGGAQGSACAFDLARYADVKRVVLADLDMSCPLPFLKPYLGSRVVLRALDARDRRAVTAAVEGMDGVLCALPYAFNYDMAELAVERGAHYCDLGGRTDIVERQKGLHERAVGQGISVIPDCGLAPGMVNILAQAGIDALDRVESVRLFVGGLPQEPVPLLNYQIVYSMQGVLDYYTTPPMVLEDGKLARREALSELEEVLFPEPVGTLEAFHTAGGASTMPFRYQGRIPGEAGVQDASLPGARACDARHPGARAAERGTAAGRRVRGRTTRFLHPSRVAPPQEHGRTRPGGSACGGAGGGTRAAEEDPLRPDRSVRRPMRRHRHDAHDRLLAGGDRAHAGGRTDSGRRGSVRPTRRFHPVPASTNSLPGESGSNERIPRRGGSCHYRRSPSTARKLSRCPSRSTVTTTTSPGS